METFAAAVRDRGTLREVGCVIPNLYAAMGLEVIAVALAAIYDFPRDHAFVGCDIADNLRASFSLFQLAAAPDQFIVLVFGQQSMPVIDVPASAHLLSFQWVI